MSAQVLKIIAILSMLIDHIGFTLNNIHRYRIAGVEMTNYMSGAYYQLRLIGRLAFPIYAFLIAEGCAHTRDIKKYMIRLSLFALISKIPYKIFNSLRYGEIYLKEYRAGNVMITLALGALSVYFYQKAWENKRKIVLCFLGILGALICSVTLRSSYDFGEIYLSTLDL